MDFPTDGNPIIATRASPDLITSNPSMGLFVPGVTVEKIL